MIASTQHQAWLFYTPLAKQAPLLKDDLIEPVDQLLDDPQLVDLVRHCLASRSPASTRTGRNGIAPDRLLRCCVLKHLKGWSFRELARELRCNLIYRRFTHFDADTTPDHTIFCRSFAVLNPSVTEKIHERVVGLARQKGVAKGRHLRTDTTAVESNVHYPTDSSLLGDGIRVLSRSLQRIAAECKSGALEVVHHGRAVKYRLLEISRAAKSQTKASRRRMRDSYHKLLALTRSVVRQAGEIVERWQDGKLPVVRSLLTVEVQASQLRHFLPLVEKVIVQTKERVWGGNTRVPDKVLSLFEPHTQVIRKGKAHRPNEFGRLVRLDEVENGIVSSYQILEGNAAIQSAVLRLNANPVIDGSLQPLLAPEVSQMCSSTFEILSAESGYVQWVCLRSVVSQTDSNLPVFGVHTQAELIDQLLFQERMIAKLSGFFGILALVLACIGLYGLLSYEVSRRTREVGIRMALGAQRRDVLRLVVGQGIVLAIAGAIVGIGVALGVTRYMKSMLYDIHTNDPATIAGVAILLTLVAVAACYIPARRATRVDPMVALRYE